MAALSPEKDGEEVVAFVGSGNWGTAVARIVGPNCTLPPGGVHTVTDGVIVLQWNVCLRSSPLRRYGVFTAEILAQALTM